MRHIREYDRGKAVAYAHAWAYRRNPMYYDYEDLGGDCTNFASQCIYAGSGIMDFTPTFGWYYISADRKAPAWTGVPYLYDYLIRRGQERRWALGPIGEACEISDILPGDIIQLSFDGERYQHCPIVVRAGTTPEEILVAAHSQDADDRPLSSYTYQRSRAVHIKGVLWP